MDRNGTLGLRRYGVAQASSTTGLVVRHTVNNTAAAARDTHPAVARIVVAVDGVADADDDVVVAVVVVAMAAVGVAVADGGPVGHRAWWQPTFVVVRATRVELAVVRTAEDRNTRDSMSAVHRPAGTAVRPAVACGETVCDDTVNCDCDGSSRAGGADLRDTRTDWSVPANNEPALGLPLADTEDWQMLVAMGNTMVLVVDGMGPVAGTGIQVAVAAAA